MIYLIIRCYGTRTSLKCWNENRGMKSFENVVEVNQRTKTESRRILYDEKSQETIPGVVTCGTRKNWRKR